MKILVGYTGFVGSNIYQSGDFDKGYNSKNIKEAFGTKPDLLMYSGLPAEKFLANSNPDKDMDLIREAENNIKLIDPKKIVLISTIDVFEDPRNVNEKTEISTKNLQPYGYNRYKLECWVREKYPEALIVRLPALFGKNIKKNFIYDFINFIPSMLNEKIFHKLLKEDSEIKKFYELQCNGFYKIKILNFHEKNELKEKFKKLKFSAINFTDSRNIYQFYPLDRLWKDIKICMKNNIKLWHPATEPILVSELYKYLTGEKFVNEILEKPMEYDYKTIHDKLFCGDNGYICNKEEILKCIEDFIKEYQYDRKKN